MTRWVVALAAVCLFTTADNVLAFGHRACCPAPYCAPACSPCYTYVTEYQKVQRTVCECVPVTVMQDFCEVVCVPVKSYVDRTECYYENVCETVPVKTIEYVCDYVKKVENVCVTRPVTKYVEQTYCVKEAVTHIQKQHYTVCVPCMRVETRTQPVNYYECVPVTQCCDVVSYQTVAVPCCPPCGSCCGSVSCCYQCVPCVTKQYYTTYQTVCKTAYETCNVNVCEYRNEVRTVDVPVCSYVDKYYKQSVPVCSYENVYVNQEYTVAVPRAIEKVVNVTYCKAVPKYRTCKVEVCSYQYQTVTVKKPVCTYQWVTKCIEECVPVTVCVPCAPSSPCYAPAPCCY